MPWHHLRLAMIKSLVILVALISFNCIAGVTILGTSFTIDDKTKRLNIKVNNDNEGDFLVKTNVYCNENDELIVTPPLFVLTRNASNIVTIIPSVIEKNNKDHLCKLSIAAIPKTPSGKDNSIYFAIRSNLHLIYRHDDLKNVDLKQLKLIKQSDNKFYIKNDTNYVLPLKVSSSEDSDSFVKKTLSPDALMPVSFCTTAKCDLWVSVIDADQSVFAKLNLSNL